MIFGNKNRVYLENRSDSILVYQLGKSPGNSRADTLSRAFPKKLYGAKLVPAVFYQPSLDLDFLTIPIKFRPGSDKLPPQLNSNLNGAVFLGYRNDVYKILYGKTPLPYSQRSTKHYGISFGLFTGLGPTNMNSFTTGFQLASEYDGIVWSKGIAAIMAINKFTLGFCGGFDNLLDNNRRIWIYESKPWLGLAFGLNLN